MGKLLQVILAIMLTSFVLVFLTDAAYQSSPDTNRTAFQTYDNTTDNQTGLILSEANQSFQDRNNPVENMRVVAINMQNQLGEAQRNLNSTDMLTRLAGAFGIAAALIMNTFFLLLAVIMQGLNMIGGIATNISNLTPPWYTVGVLISLVSALFIIYVIIKIISAHKGYEI